MVDRDELTPRQLARVWEPLTGIKFHEVVEVPAEPEPLAMATVYAVVRSIWRYDDSGYNGHNDALAVYRTREGAEAARDRQRAALGVSGMCPDGGPDELVVVKLQMSPEG